MTVTLAASDEDWGQYDGFGRERVL